MLISRSLILPLVRALRLFLSLRRPFLFARPSRLLSSFLALSHASSPIQSISTHGSLLTSPSVVYGLLLPQMGSPVFQVLIKALNHSQTRPEQNTPETPQAIVE